jgi:pimeloyl-ACP methyl ester carboxylesterase
LSAYDPDPDNYTPATYVNDIRHLLSLCGVGKVHVIGTSLGGFVAMVMAVAMPTVLASVVLNDIGPEIGRQSLGGIIDYMDDDAPLSDWDAVTEHVRGAFLPNLPNGTDEDWRRIALNTYRVTGDGRYVHDFDTAIVKQFRRALSQKQDLWPLFLALGHVPVLVLRGALSGILEPETLTAMGVAMPAMTALTVDDRGHPPLLSEPPVLEAIDAHLF